MLLPFRGLKGGQGGGRGLALEGYLLAGGGVAVEADGGGGGDDLARAVGVVAGLGLDDGGDAVGGGGGLRGGLGADHGGAGGADSFEVGVDVAGHQFVVVLLGGGVEVVEPEVAERAVFVLVAPVEVEDGDVVELGVRGDGDGYRGEAGVEAVGSVAEAFNAVVDEELEDDFAAVGEAVAAAFAAVGLCAVVAEVACFAVAALLVGEAAGFGLQSRAEGECRAGGELVEFGDECEPVVAEHAGASHAFAAVVVGYFEVGEFAGVEPCQVEVFDGFALFGGELGDVAGGVGGGEFFGCPSLGGGDEGEE